MTTALGDGLRRVAAKLAPDDAPDGELLARFLADRDEAAFAALVRRHAAMVLGTCRRVLGNAADADDAFQAAFVVLARRAAGFTGRATVGNFLYGVAYHTARKAKAMAAKRRLREAKADRPAAPADDAELHRALDEELARLPEKYREPVVLCELEGKPRREVAVTLGIPEGTMSSRLATAHRMLQKRLQARGFATAGVAALLADRTATASPALATAAVQAALTGPTGGVSQLVAEVSKMLFLSKLKFGAAVVGVAVALTVGGLFAVGSRDLRGEDKPPAGAAAAADARKPPTAEEVYTLADGEVLKLIPAPFPEGRNKVLGKLIPQQEPGQPFGWYVFTTTDGKRLKVFRGNSGQRPGEKVGETIIDNSTALDYFIRTALGLDEQELYGLDPHLDGTVDSNTRYCLDVIVRENTPLEKLVPALQEQLRAKYKLDLTFTYTHEERECVRLTGKHTLADPKRNVLDLYADDKSAKPPVSVIGRTEGPVVANTLSRFLGVPVFDSSDLNKRSLPVEVRAHKRVPPTPATQAADCDPDKVLKHFADQTGLTAERVRQKVRRLQVQQPAAPPKPGAADEPAWKKDFDTAYALKDGEVLRRIPPPFPAARDEYLKRTTKEPQELRDQVVYWYRMDGRKVEARGASNRYRKEPASSLANFLWFAGSAGGLPRQEFECSEGLLSRAMPGEFVVRGGVKAEDFAAALERILRDELKWAVRVTVEAVERDVIVATGRFVPNASSGPPAKVFVDVSDPKRPRLPDNKFGTVDEFLNDIAGYLNRRVVNDGVKAADLVKWSYRHGPRPDPNVGLDAVLGNVMDQTGLKLTKAKRKVRVISIVEDAK